jgi:hypothetical protein
MLRCDVNITIAAMLNLSRHKATELQVHNAALGSLSRHKATAELH